jgi:phenylalanyl-tRNA synthetase alpha chain
VGAIEQECARVRSDGLARVASAADERELDAVRVAYLGKKGELTGLLRGVSALPTAERPCGPPRQ